MYRAAAAILVSVAVSPFGASAQDAATEPPRGTEAGLERIIEQKGNAELKAKLLTYIQETFSRPRLVPQDSGSFRGLRFSPDGRYALAQNSSAVTVLSVQPFGVLFRAPAEHAGPAAFTPDSRQVVFVSSIPTADSRQIEVARTSAKVEHWSVAGHNPLSSTAVDVQACQTRELSPDGGTLACVEPGGTLRLIDVASGAPVFEKKKFAQEFTIASADFTCAEIMDTLRRDPKSSKCTYGDPGAALIGFSSDGRFLIASPEFAQGAPVLWDLQEKREVSAAGALKQLTGGGGFVFVAPDRLIMRGAERARRDAVTAPVEVVAFPSGKLLSKAELPPGVWARTADPGFVLIRPFGKPSAWAVEFRTGQAITSKTSSLDVSGNLYLAERANGEVGLYERGKGLRAAVTIPQN